MSLVRVHDPKSLLVALEVGEDQAVVGFFDRSYEVSQSTLPEFEKFCAEHEDLATHLVDIGMVPELAGQFGVDSVPAVLRLSGTRVMDKVVGPQTAQSYALAFVGEAGGPTRSHRPSPHRVTVYTTSTCPWCVRVKDYLQKQGVSFREIDVARNARAAQRMVELSGQQGVPQLEIDGQMVVGFDKERIDSLLGLHQASPVAS